MRRLFYLGGVGYGAIKKTLKRRYGEVKLMDEEKERREKEEDDKWDEANSDSVEICSLLWLRDCNHLMYPSY